MAWDGSGMTKPKQCSRCENVLMGAYGLTCGEYLVRIHDEKEAETCEAYEDSVSAR